MTFQNKKTVYHYTTHDAAFKIVAHSELWFSNIRFLNDENEWKWVLEHAKKHLNERLRNGTPINPIIAEDPKWSSDIDKNISVCISCFSYNDDDAAQWDRYSNQGRGVAVGFSEDILCQSIKKLNGLAGKVEYSEDLLNEEIDKTFDYLEKEMSERGRHLLRRSNDPISLLSPFFKHKSFISESEFRLVLLGVPYMKYQFFSRDDTIVPYTPFSFPSDAITEICVGPKSAKESISAWRLLLAKKRFKHIAIRKSNSTLR